MFKVGDRVRVQSFERCPPGTGMIISTNYPFPQGQRDPRYDVQVNRDDIRFSDDDSMYQIWWFPLSSIEHLEVKYDPKQAGDREDDI